MQPLFLTEGVAFSASGPEGIHSLPMDTIGAALSKGSDLNFLPPAAKKELGYRNAFSKAISGLIILLGIFGSTLLIMNKKNSDTQHILSAFKESLARVRYENREYEQLLNERNALNAVQARIQEETIQDSSTLSILKWVSSITPDEIILEQLSWGEGYNEIELRRAGTNQAMRSNGTGLPKLKDEAKELHLKGAVYVDIFYGDIHLLNFITTMEKNPFFQEVQLKEKRQNADESIMSFELIAKKK
jgi:Tfp pilus assembly protein PilN